MAYSYLTPAEKTLYNDEFNNLHLTFGRPITIFRTSQRIVLQTNPDHNFLFDHAPNNDVVENIVQSGTFLARIKYGTKEKKTPFNTIHQNGATDQMSIQLEEGEVRIKLDPTGAAYIQGAQRVTFDGTVFEINTSKRPHGLFDPNFETFFLKKLN